MDRRRLLRASLPAALLLGLLACSAVASAHAVPLQTTPAPGSVVRALPAEVVLVMSERLDAAFSQVRVLNASRDVVSGPSSIDPDGVTLRASLPRDLAYGTYTVAWKALSRVDGHPTKGVVLFLYPDPSKPLQAGDLPSTEAGGEATVPPLDPPLRWLGFVGLFVAAGSAVLVLGVVGRDAPPEPWAGARRLALLVAATSAIAALATVGLAGLSAAAARDLPLQAVLGQPRLVFQSAYGRLAFVRLLLLLGIVAVAAVASRPRLDRRFERDLWLAAGGLGLAGLATVSLTSHAAALPGPGPLPMLLDWLHLAAGAAWIGGLLGLGWVLTRPRAGDAMPPVRVAARFSTLATVGVAVIVATGVVAAVLQLKTLGALTGSEYGRVLLLKLALVAGAVGLGGHHKLRLVPQVLAASAEAAGDAWRRFGRSLRIEAAFGVGVLLATGLLTALSPPAPMVEVPQGPAVYEASLVQEGVNITLLISPFPIQVGLATVDVFLRDADTGVSLNETKSATFTFEPPDRALGAQEVEATSPHPAHYAAEGAFFSMPGAWKLHIVVRRATAFDVVADFEVPVTGG